MTQPNPTDTLHYSSDFSGLIWKLIPDASFRHIWIEVRDEVKMSVSWKRIDVEQGTDRIIEKFQNVNWWDSLVAAYGDLIIVQRMENKTNPGPGTIRLIDTKSGNEVFKVKQSIFIGLDGQRLVYQTSDQLEESYLDLNKWQDTPKTDPWKVLIPSVYPVTHNYYQVVAGFLNAKGINSEGPVSYFEYGQSILIYYHHKLDDELCGNLLWIKEGKEYFHKKIDSQMTGYALESFLVMGRYLIFVVNRKKLNIHLL
jgi:hypothetical protein